MAYKKISEHPKYSENPYLSETEGSIEQKSRRMFLKTSDGRHKPQMIVSDDGEVLGATQFIRDVKVDATEFRKLYVANLKSFFNLKSSSMRVLLYIMSVLKPGQGQVIFDIDECLDFTGYKGKKSILSSLAELVETEFIARSKHTAIYFINPTIFFNGNRIEFVKRYTLSDTTAEHVMTAKSQTTKS